LLPIFDARQSTVNIADDIFCLPVYSHLHVSQARLEREISSHAIKPTARGNISCMAEPHAMSTAVLQRFLACLSSRS